ncbi:hypothetical protein V8F20_005229, partial [Naviculisporaceae sp. PSN 640]
INISLPVELLLIYKKKISTNYYIYKTLLEWKKKGEYFEICFINILEIQGGEVENSDGGEGDEKKWLWKGSAKLGNLECVVYRFASSSQSSGTAGGVDEAAIEEVPPHEAREEREILGKYYRHMSSEVGIKDEDYVQTDGTTINQKAGHWKFIQYKASDVQRFAKERMDVLEALVNWRGVDDFMSRYGENLQRPDSSYAGERDLGKNYGEV